MPILPRLVSLYESRGIGIATGLDARYFDGLRHAPFTWFLKDGKSLTEGLGIALQEVYLLECLFARFRPRSVFVIGNSLGWSTLAIALTNPEAQVLAIDAGLDRHSRVGIDFTNRVAAEERLTVSAAFGKSPDDVAACVAEADLPPIEFAFIDGYHSVDQVQLDFRAVKPLAAPDCVYLFHDVAAFGLTAGIERIASENGMRWQLLLGTPSGMAIVYNPAHSPPALADIAPFIASPEAVRVLSDAAWAHRHRHLARWRRSLRKRLGRTARGSR
ncbi:MAG TPA: class I SAM-dependent methyltransferase [Stellaceae bacterium]|nr:class I SAM-dependent methyltransferase [Stellaceae bacterium]